MCLSCLPQALVVYSSSLLTKKTFKDTKKIQFAGKADSILENIKKHNSRNH